MNNKSTILKGSVSCLFFAINLLGCVQSQQAIRSDVVSDQGQPLPIRLTNDSAEDTTQSFKLSSLISIDQFEGFALVDGPQPRPIHTVIPIMPDSSIVARKEGTVWLKGLVDTSGNVLKTNVFKTNDTIFNRAALRAFVQWKFAPPVVDGKPISTWILVPIRFRLNSK